MEIRRFDTSAAGFNSWLYLGKIPPGVGHGDAIELARLGCFLRDSSRRLGPAELGELKLLFLMVHDLRSIPRTQTPVAPCGCAWSPAWTAVMERKATPDSVKDLYGLLKYSYLTRLPGAKTRPNNVCGVLDWSPPAAMSGELRCRLCRLMIPSRVCAGGHLFCYACFSTRCPCIECGLAMVSIKN